MKPFTDTDHLETAQPFLVLPNSWLFFGYVALAIAALMSGSAVQVAFAPAAGQAALSTPAILLFALWALWFGVMVVRLKPE